MRHTSLRLRLTAVLCLAALASLACAVGGTATPTPPTPTPNPDALLAPNTTASATTNGIALHLIGADNTVSLQNAPILYPTLGVACDPLLVFTTAAPQNLSSTEVASVRGYLQGLPAAAGGNFVPSPSPRPPASLRWVAGSRNCRVRLEVSNVTTQNNQSGRDISIVGLDLRVAAAPVPNTYAYRDPLVDVCSAGYEAGPCTFAGSGPDMVYIGTATLSASSGAGTTSAVQLAVSSEADPTQYPPPPFLLQRGQTRDIDLDIVAAGGASPSIYQVVPELTINDGSLHTIAFSPLQSAVVFSTVSTAGAGCYGVLRQNGVDRIVPASQIQYAANVHGACK
jgi:hypothetical protein